MTGRLAARTGSTSCSYSPTTSASATSAVQPGSLIPTPNIDRLVAESVAFDDAHSSSAVCTPSRYSLLTGRYCWRSPLKSGVFYGYEPPLVEADRPTLPRMLQQLGYRTAAIGKWHLGLGYELRKGANVDLARPFPWSERPVSSKSRSTSTGR